MPMPSFPPLVPAGWSEELLRDAWSTDRAAACEKAGILVDSTTQKTASEGEMGSPSLSLTVHTVTRTYITS